MEFSKLKQAQERATLAKMVTRLFSLWGLPIKDQLCLLGYSDRSEHILRRYKSGDPLANRRTLLERVGHLLAIHEALRIIFPYDRDLVYQWITSANSNILFSGEPPLATMKRGIDGLRKVRGYLQHMTQV